MTCAKCHTTIPLGEDACSFCGQPVPGLSSLERTKKWRKPSTVITCPDCRTSLPPSAVLCPNCGHQAGDTPARSQSLSDAYTVIAPQQSPRKSSNSAYGLASLILVLGGIIVGCDSTSTNPASSDTSSQSGYISRADLGKDWPLTVDSAVIGHDICDGVTLTINGTVYAVNGIARGELRDPSSGDKTPRYEDFNTSGYWAADPSGIAPKMDIGPIIDRGLKMPAADQ